MKVKHSAKAIGASGAARAALMRLVTAVVVAFIRKCRTDRNLTLFAVHRFDMNCSKSRSSASKRHWKA